MRQNQTKKRYGVIDIGSNSIRMMLFDYNGKAQPFANVKKYLRSTRLGHGVDASGNLAETSVARSIDALVELKGIADAEDVEEIYAFGTSAMRDAGNASALTAPVLEKTGIAIDIVDGDTEAKYGFYGVSSCFSGNILIADIGGGSTELICGSSAAGIAWDKSLNIGAVRDTEKFSPREGTGCHAARGTHAASRHDPCWHRRHHYDVFGDASAHDGVRRIEDSHEHAFGR